MPQMSPLLWGNLFIIFSSLIFLAAVKMYFNYSKQMMVTGSTCSKPTKKMFIWLW